jgi:hypothetical protein
VGIDFIDQLLYRSQDQAIFYRILFGHDISVVNDTREVSLGSCFTDKQIWLSFVYS